MGHITPWKAMEGLVAQGLAKQIGVCNYNTGLLHDLMSYARIKPAMLQIESHPYLTQEALIRTAQGYGMAVTAFSPLGSASYVELDMATEQESALAEPAITQIAQRHGVSAAQVVLRWGLQRGDLERSARRRLCRRRRGAHGWLWRDQPRRDHRHR
mgnify:CR=1 FL=1